MTKFIAKGSYGSTHFIDSKHPRKWLMEYYGVTKATKIYRGDEAKHVGWVIAGQWFEVFKVSPLN